MTDKTTQELLPSRPLATEDELARVREALTQMVMYADISQPVEGVVYGFGTHADVIKRARAVLSYMQGKTVEPVCKSDEKYSDPILPSTPATSGHDEQGSVVAAAYLSLLMVPHSSPLRLKIQPILARCRDFIAKETGVEPEIVHSQFEAEAAPTSEETSQVAREGIEK